ncbi:SDR family NAD(P)-dependent oxidoreductase [Nocardiopsis ansamitocini]|nr:SDR family oxidoreductase [Nocardiopsis ansamitocini]
MTTVAVGAAAVAAAALVKAYRMTDLRGKVVLVTGGSRGLGLLLARELGAQGCRVAVCARDENELKRAVRDLEVRGTRALGLPCDVRDPDQARAAVAEAAAHFGQLDIVVNNAGVIQAAPLDAVDIDDFDNAMRTMFWASLHVAQAARPHLRHGGTLVTITSVGGVVSPPHLLPYACAKSAQVALSEGLDAELAAEGIRVLTVVPGLMRTGSHRRASFAGNPGAEYAWFAVAAGLPVLSTDAKRAARRTVAAIRSGRHHLVLTPLARTALVAHGVAPAATQGVLRAVHRMLPRPGGEGAVSGLEAGPRADRWGARLLTALNDRASRRFNQYPAPGETPAG